MKNEPKPFNDDDASKLIHSSYFKKTDFDDVDDIPLVIASVEQTELTDKKTNETRLRLQLLFEGEDKKVGLNQGNLKLLIQSYGKKTSGWIGKPVILYWDPGVVFAGELVGGLRLRVPRTRTAKPAPQPKVVDPSSAVPF